MALAHVCGEQKQNPHVREDLVKLRARRNDVDAVEFRRNGFVHLLELHLHLPLAVPPGG